MNSLPLKAVQTNVFVMLCLCPIHASIWCAKLQFPTRLNPDGRKISTIGDLDNNNNCFQTQCRNE